MDDFSRIKNSDSDLMKIYRPAFARAISKLTNPNRYGADGYIKKECVLSEEELNAIMIYTPEIFNSKFMDSTKKNQL